MKTLPVVFVLVLSCCFRAIAGEPQLTEVQRIEIPDLEGSICVAISADGRFAYVATGGHAREVSTFTRDLQTGRLEFVEAVKRPDVICPMRLRFSADENYLVVADANTKSAPIFRRDAATGKLTKFIDISADLVAKAALTSVQDAHLSPDGRFLYVAGVNGLAIFQVANHQISLVQVLANRVDMADLRPFALSPDARFLYCIARASNMLTVFSRDATSGKIKSVQTLQSGVNDIDSLRGAFRVDASRDGKNVYVSAGRYERDDHAVTVFTVQADGTLKLLQKLVNGTDDLSEFEGGNEIRVSPDGKSVCAVASLSDRLFYFRREPETGKLTFITSAQVGNFKTPGAAGVCFSPDSKFAYVADEIENIVDVFKLP